MESKNGTEHTVLEAHFSYNELLLNLTENVVLIGRDAKKTLWCDSVAKDSSLHVYTEQKKGLYVKEQICLDHETS